MEWVNSLLKKQNDILNLIRQNILIITVRIIDIKKGENLQMHR